MSTPLVFNIQKFSVHDGDGIRTTIFFKGCPLRCQWCHNPESQSYQKEMILHRHKCTVCGGCIKGCPHGVNEIVDGQMVFHRERCIGCGQCVEWCLTGAREIAGKEYTVQQLVKEAKKDETFYDKSGGGVTLSGGEVMAVQDFDYVVKLCKALKREGISLFIDTSGFCSYDRFQQILPYVDVFLYDLKAINNEDHKAVIGVGNELILENLVKLSDAGAGIYLRLPIIVGKNAKNEDLEQIMDFLEEHKVRLRQINLLPYHDIGRGKYAGLDRPYDEEDMAVPDGEEMEKLKTMFEERGFHNIKIGG